MAPQDELRQHRGERAPTVLRSKFLKDTYVSRGGAAGRCPATTGAGINSSRATRPNRSGTPAVTSGVNGPLKPRRRLPWLVAVLLVLATSVGVAATTTATPDRAVNRAAGSLDTMQAIALDGTIEDALGRRTAAHLIVTADGSAHGTLTRGPNGAAEIISNGEKTAVRGNVAWWLDSPHPGAASELADKWIADPPVEMLGFTTTMLTPRRIAGALRGSDLRWSTADERVVDDHIGVDHRADTDSALAVIGFGSGPRLLAINMPVSRLHAIGLRAFATETPEEGAPVPRFAFGVSEPGPEDRSDLLDYLSVLEHDVTNTHYGEITQLWRDAISKDGTYGPSILFTIDQLVYPPRGTRGFSQEQAIDFVRKSVAGGFFSSLHEIAQRMDRIESVPTFVAFYDKIKDQLVNPKTTERGHVRHLEEFARLLQDPTTRIGIEDGTGDIRIVGSDKITIKVYQTKSLRSDELETFKGTLDKIRVQLSGKGGEQPPPGATRAGQIIAERTAWGGLGTATTRTQILAKLQDAGAYSRLLDPKTGKPGVDELIITNRLEHNGVATEHRFSVQNDLRPLARPGGGTTSQSTVFGPPGSGQAKGAATNPVTRPGGIDLSSMELRYLADTGAKQGLKYAFTAPPTKGGSAGPDAALAAARRSSDAFFVWLALDRSTFWVNLNPDEPDRVIDPELGQTEAGRVLLEADLQLKRTIGTLTHPDKPLGARYWSSLQAGEGLITCSSFRYWIRPAPATVHEANGELYILDAPLDVAMETMFSSQTPPACRQQPASIVEHNIAVGREVILPELVKAVNTAPEYAELRRAYLSRVAAEWYRQRSARQPTTYGSLIDSRVIDPWTSRQPWSARTVYDDYLKSVRNSEYSVVGEMTTPDGSVLVQRTYGGVILNEVPLANIDAAAFHDQYPDTADAVARSLDEPTADSSGQVWIGSNTPASPQPPTVPAWVWICCGALAVCLPIAALVLLRRCRRRRRDLPPLDGARDRHPPARARSRP